MYDKELQEKLAITTRQHYVDKFFDMKPAKAGFLDELGGYLRDDRGYCPWDPTPYKTQIEMGELHNKLARMIWQQRGITI